MFTYILFKFFYKYGGSNYFVLNETSDTILKISKMSWTKVFVMKTLLFCMQKTCPPRELQTKYPEYPWNTINAVLQNPVREIKSSDAYVLPSESSAAPEETLVSEELSVEKSK